VIEALNNGADSYLQKGGKSMPQYAELEHRIRAVVQRHRAEDALRQSEERYRTILDQAADGIIVHDATGRILDVNQKLCRNLGYSREELLSKSIKDIDPEAVLEGKPKLWNAVFAGESFTFESRQMRKDGSTIPVEVTLGSVHLPLGSAILGIVRDITERKIVESTIRESERKYRLLAENINDVIWTLNIATQRFTYISPSVEKLRGFTVEEAMQQTMKESVHPDSYAEIIRHLPAWIEQFRHGDQASTSRRDIVRQSRKDGTWVTVEIISTLLQDDKGEITEVLGVSRDVTARVSAEETLIQSQDLMRYVIEHNRSAIAVHERDLKYLFVSQRYLQDYKVKEKDVIGKHHYDVFPDLPQKWREVYQRALAGEILSAEDDPYVREDGSVDWTRWECRPWYEADGSIGGIIIYTEVITERKRAEEALRMLIVRNDAILAAVPDIIVEVDDCKRITWTNQPGLRFYGKDVVGREASYYFEGEQETYAKVQPLFDGSEDIIHLESWQRRQDGEKRLLSWRCRALKDKQGRAIGALSSARDITERKRIEEALRESENRSSSWPSMAAPSPGKPTRMASTPMSVERPRPFGDTARTSWWARSTSTT